MIIYTRVIIIFSEKYFHQLSRKECKEGFDMYKKFVVRMDACEKIFNLAKVMNERYRAAVSALVAVVSALNKSLRFV